MRRYATFFAIAVMSLGLVFLLVTRVRTPRNAPPEIVEAPAADADAGADAGALDAAAAVAVADAGAAKPPGDKPIRVAALGWELVAAGATDSAKGMELAPETTLDAVEARLARGGSDPQGADVAIVPLPAFVASYERLRALEPRAFLVVGFSHGREEVRAAPGALMKPPPGADEVKMVALGPSTADDANMQRAGSQSATVLGLFALDLLGVPPTRLRFVPAGSEAAKPAAFAAVVRGAPDDRKLALSTADASRFVPIVAVAPKAQLESRGKALEEWSRAWIEGIEKAGKDASTVARRLAAKDNIPLAAGVGGAPEALHLVERLGQVEAASLAQQGALVGPNAKGAVTLESLLSRTWQLSRAGGLTASAAPEPLPIDPRVVTAIAPKPAPPAPRETPADADAGATFAPLAPGATPLALYRATDGAADVSAVAAQIAFLSGVFERAVFRVSAKGGEKAARAIAAAARDAHGVPASRLSTAPAEPAGAFAAVEILAPP